MSSKHLGGLSFLGGAVLACAIGGNVSGSDGRDGRVSAGVCLGGTVVVSSIVDFDASFAAVVTDS